MLAISKRRASLYTLPLVVLIGFLAVAGLAAWQRSDLIADLTDQVSHGEQGKAAAAVRQLAAMPKPPLPILVEAAAADDHPTAEAGQVAINRLLSQWQRQLEKKQHVSSIADELTELAAALASQRQAFSRSDYPWLSGVTHKIVRLGNKCPAKKTPLVALHCDELMSIVGNTAIAASTSSHTESSDSLHVDQATPPQEADNRTKHTDQRQREFSEFQSKPIKDSALGEAAGESPEAAIPPPIAEGGSSPAGGNGDPAASQAQNAQSSDDLPTAQQPKEPDWSQPMYRILPVNDHHAADAATTRAVVPGDASSSTNNEVRRLLTQWRDSNSSVRFGIEEELAARGFRRFPTRLMKQYFSDNPQERLKVVDTVLTEPNVDSRQWLLLLSDDENADVRLSAVTVMATSGDKALVEAALQAAIRDNDPRIADLAGRLRSRR